MALQTISIVNHAAGLMDIMATAVAADVALSDWWVNTGNELIFVNNAGATSITVTDTIPGSYNPPDGLSTTPRTHTIAAGKFSFLGPYPTQIYNAGSTNFMTLTWSAVASVKLLVFIKGA
jgi:hypothetical protein